MRGTNRMRFVPWIRNSQLVFWLPALFLIPAAVMCGIYPTSQFLGSARFFFNNVELREIRWFLLFPLIGGAALAAVSRQWVAAALLIPGALLILSPPERLGTDATSFGVSGALYPENFNAEKYRSRVAQLGQTVKAFGWISNRLQPYPPATDGVNQAVEGAVQAVEVWRSITSAYDASRAEIEGKISQKKEQVAKLGLAYNQACRAICQPPPELLAVGEEIVHLTKNLKRLTTEKHREIATAYAAATANTAIAKASLETHERWVSEKKALVESLPYNIVASVSFAWILWSIGFQSVTMAILLSGTLMASIWFQLRLDSNTWFVQAPMLLYPLFACGLAAVALRFLFRAIQDNAEIVKVFPHDVLITSGLVAFVAWLPFALVVGGIYSSSSWIYDQTSQAIYCENPKIQWCRTDDAWVKDSDPGRETLREDLHMSVDRLYAELEAEAIGAGVEAKVATPDAIDNAKGKVMATFDAILKPNIWDYDADLAPRKCDLLEIKCYARNFAISAVNKAYQGPRDRMRTRLDRRLTEVAGYAENTAQTAANGFIGAIQGESQRAATATNQAVDVTFLWLSVVTMTKNAVLLMIAVRGFLLIFARLLFRSDPKSERLLPHLALTHLEPTTVPTPLPEITISKDSTLKLELKPFEALLVKRNFSVTNAAPATLLMPPFISRWFLSRILYRCLWMKRVTEREDKRSIELSDTQGAQFVLWRIPDGAKVAFRWRHFVAMSESATLEKTISLRFGMLILGHMMLPSVSGPAILVQRTFGSPVATNLSPEKQAVEPRRVLAWLEGTRFQIISSKNVLNVYTDDCHVEAHEDGAAIFDVGGSGGGGSGVFREFLKLFRP